MVEKMNNAAASGEKGIKIFRWYFHIALLQLVLYFTVPAIVFPGSVVIDIEIISALTTGMIVCAFFLFVNIVGFFLDKSRRILYGTLMSLVTAYFLWVIIVFYRENGLLASVIRIASDSPASAVSKRPPPDETRHAPGLSE
jgi:hypothetical protein